MVLNAWKVWVQTPESEVKGAGREPLGSSGGKASLTNGEAEAQKVKDSSRWKNNPDRKSQPSDSGLRSLFLWWPQESLVLGHFLILCVARPLLGGGSKVWTFSFLGGLRESLEMDSTSALASRKGRQRSDMNTWPPVRPPWGDEIGKTLDEKSNTCFIFQSFGTIPRFPHTFAALWCFICTTKVELFFQSVSRKPAGFLENLKQMDKLCDLHSHPLESLWLIFYNGPGIWVASKRPGLHGFFGRDQRLLKTAQAWEAIGNCAPFFHSYLLLQSQPSHLFPKIVRGSHSPERLKS